MDDADMAAERDAAIAPYLVANSRRPGGPAANGRCHFCDAEVGEHMRFCNAECRDDYEVLQRRQR